MHKLDSRSAVTKLIRLVVKKSQSEHIYPPNALAHFQDGHDLSHPGRWVVQKNIKLRSYITVCVDSGLIDRAINFLAASQRAHVTHYNIVLKSLAQSGSVGKFKKFRELMSRKNISGNMDTYVMSLLAYAKSADKDYKSIGRIIDRICNMGDINKIFQNTYLNKQERDLVTSIVKIYKPDFQDLYHNIPTGYRCNLTENLSNLPSIPYDIGPPKNPRELVDLAEEQYRLEKEPSVFIRSIAKPRYSSQMLRKFRKIWQAHVEIWRKVLTEALRKEMKEMEKSHVIDNRINLYPYLRSIKTETLVSLLLDEIEVVAFWVSYSLPANLLHKALGHRVMTHYIRQKEILEGSYEEKKELFSHYLKEYYTNPDIAGQYNSRVFIQTKACDMKNYAIYRDHFDQIPEWPAAIQASLGKLLYSILLREIKFDQSAAGNPNRKVKPENMIDAFYTAYSQVPDTYKIKEEFRTHRDLERLQRKCGSYMLRFSHDQLPCTCPPMPWITSSIGGYLSTRTQLARDKSLSKDFSSLRQFDQQKLYPSLDSLNALGLCPWIVNQDILDLAIKLFRSGGDPQLKVPHDESTMTLAAPQRPDKESTEADKIMFSRESKKYEKKKTEMYSLWSDCLYRLSIANHFRDKVFWLPHNMDFRGRTYPVAPHFNHLGADLPRSLLLFAKGRPLGDHGLDWLKIHVINLGGTMKKCSIKERLEFANSILHTDILDSADNPWDGKRWWQKHDNPWQVLAACKEIAKAIRSKNVKEYVSHLPVHQDGSCNGLQHYAALGRDSQGALAVNLIPSDRPHDVYSHIVDIVEEARQRDAEAGNEHALRLKGLVQRKVIKQTVMTTVYGVTRYGAHQQIARQLTNRGYPQEMIWKSSHYLTVKTFESIGKIFSSSMQIQAWLNECAKTVATRFNQPVDWETPLGLPVVQPYMKKQETEAISFAGSPSRTSPMPVLSLESFEILDNYAKQNSHQSGPCVNLQDKLMRINRSKHKTAFPPNYIHSLDSSHMMLTSLYCQKAGLTFVSVHDCFWTHASSIDAMNVICREQFIALHSEPLLHILAQHFVNRFAPSNSANQTELDYQKDENLIKKLDTARQKADESQRLIFFDVPKQGDLDLNVVRNSTYFFS